jgi:hypothetical protein
VERSCRLRTFPRWHCWQSWHIAATSLAMTFQTKRAAIIRFVARIPGWAMLWMVWKMATLSASGTSGLVMPGATSHSRLAPSTWTVLTVREEDLMACSMLDSFSGWLPSWGRRCSQLAADLPCHLPRQVVKVERIHACLPTWRQPETWRALLHRSPPRKAPPSHVSGGLERV